MDYSNPKIPEGINTSHQHPLKEFFQLGIGVLFVLVLLISILGLISDKLAHHIPYSAEHNIPAPRLKQEIKGKPINRYLERLTSRISKAAELPTEMQITVHYVNADTINAFATLGGHIILLRGLLEKLPNENSLSMVLAHEIAHIKHRHPIRTIGRGVVIGLALSLVSRSIGDAMTTQIVGDTSYVTSLKFNRDHEHEADATALQVLRNIYGHLNGAEDLFYIIQKHANDSPYFEFISTHPISSKRIQRIKSAKQLDIHNKGATTQALPKDFASWLKVKKN